MIQSRTWSDFLSDVWFTLLTQMATAAILGCFRGIVHQKKLKILLFFLTCMSFLLLLNAKEYIGTILVTNSCCMTFIVWKKKKRKKNTLFESMGTKNLLVMNILQGSCLFVTYTIIQGIISSEMEVRTGPLNGQCKKNKNKRWYITQEHIFKYR